MRSRFTRKGPNKTIASYQPAKLEIAAESASGSMEAGARHSPRAPARRTIVCRLALRGRLVWTNSDLDGWVQTEALMDWLADELSANAVGRYHALSGVILEQFREEDSGAAGAWRGVGDS